MRACVCAIRHYVTQPRSHVSHHRFGICAWMWLLHRRAPGCGIPASALLHGGLSAQQLHRPRASSSAPAGRASIPATSYPPGVLASQPLALRRPRHVGNPIVQRLRRPRASSSSSARSSSPALSPSGGFLPSQLLAPRHLRHYRGPWHAAIIDHTHLWHQLAGRHPRVLYPPGAQPSQLRHYVIYVTPGTECAATSSTPRTLRGQLKVVISVPSTLRGRCLRGFMHYDINVTPGIRAQRRIAHAPFGSNRQGAQLTAGSPRALRSSASAP